MLQHKIYCDTLLSPLQHFPCCCLLLCITYLATVPHWRCVAQAGKKHDREEAKDQDTEAEVSEASEEEAEGNASAEKQKSKKVKKQAPPTNQHVKTKAGTERQKKKTASAAQNKTRA